MSQPSSRHLSPILATVAISLAVAGYFTGLQAPMTDHRTSAGTTIASQTADAPTSAGKTIPITDEDVLPATHYSKMALATRSRAEQQRKPSTWISRFGPTVLANLPAIGASGQILWPSHDQTSGHSSLGSIADPADTSHQDTTNEITAADKNFALELRSLNRAFNGAPPTVPHPVDPMSSESCMLCHGQGFSLASLRASKMSHQFLSECTQCHVESNPQHMTASLFRESSFVGLPAPTAGPRAFPGAPPQIPHSTWMRADCLSCHGSSGALGIQTTHPWRQDCQQCHAPASVLENGNLVSVPSFLEPMKITQP